MQEQNKTYKDNIELDEGAVEWTRSPGEANPK